MLRNPKLLPLLSLLAATAAMAQQPAPTAPATAAQQAATAPQADARQQLEQPPRQVEPIERSPEPPLIPPKEPTTRIVERKTGNVVTEVEVTASGSTYVLRPKTGTAETGAVDGGPSRAPLWSLFRFGQPKPKEAEQAAEGEQQTSGTPAAGQRAEAPPPPRPATPVK